MYSIGKMKGKCRYKKKCKREFFFGISRRSRRLKRNVRFPFSLSLATICAGIPDYYSCRSSISSLVFFHSSRLLLVSLICSSLLLLIFSDFVHLVPGGEQISFFSFLYPLFSYSCLVVPSKAKHNITSTKQICLIVTLGYSNLSNLNPRIMSPVSSVMVGKILALLSLTLLTDEHFQLHRTVSQDTKLGGGS